MSHRILVIFFALLFLLGTSSYAFAASGKPHVKKHVKKQVTKKDKKHHHHHHQKPR
jgi:hypothetical protein